MEANIKLGAELVRQAYDLARLGDNPLAKSYAERLRRIVLKSADPHNNVLAYAHAQGERLTANDLRGLQILLTHEEYTQIESSN